MKAVVVATDGMEPVAQQVQGNDAQVELRHPSGRQVAADLPRLAGIGRRLESEGVDPPGFLCAVVRVLVPLLGERRGRMPQEQCLRVPVQHRVHRSRVEVTGRLPAHLTHDQGDDRGQEPVQSGELYRAVGVEAGVFVRAHQSLTQPHPRAGAVTGAHGHPPHFVSNAGERGDWFGHWVGPFEWAAGDGRRGGHETTSRPTLESYVRLGFAAMSTGSSRVKIADLGFHTPVTVTMCASKSARSTLPLAGTVAACANFSWVGSVIWVSCCSDPIQACGVDPTRSISRNVCETMSTNRVSASSASGWLVSSTRPRYVGSAR